jgi:TRAP-type C4-dicarboxylate transport system substrate-binding protein
MNRLLVILSVLVFIVSFGSTAAAAPQFKFKMGHANPVDTPYDQTAKQFAQLAKEKDQRQGGGQHFPQQPAGRLDRNV